MTHLVDARMPSLLKKQMEKAEEDVKAERKARKPKHEKTSTRRSRKSY